MCHQPLKCSSTGVKNQVHCQTEDNNTPKKCTSPCKGEHSAYTQLSTHVPKILSRLKSMLSIQKKNHKRDTFARNMKWPTNPKSTWCSRIFTEKSSTMNICLITTSLRLAADRHSSSFCQNILGDTSLTPYKCALGGPLHVTTHTFATESSTFFSSHSQLPSH